MTALAPSSTPISPAARPIAIDAGPVAVLLCHGFTGSPATMRPWAEELARCGYTVRVPRLPGHGTRWEDLAGVAWTDWYAAVDDAWAELRHRHARVFVAGLSMGGSLALRLAQRHSEVAGLILVNPAVASHDPRLRTAGLLHHLVPSVAGVASDIAKPAVVEDGAYGRTPVRAVHTMTQLWRTVRADLGNVRQPLLCFRSRVDHVVDRASLEQILRHTAAADVTVRILPRSYHVATLDHDAPQLFAESVAWIAARSEQP